MPVIPTRETAWQTRPSVRHRCRASLTSQGRLTIKRGNPDKRRRLSCASAAAWLFRGRVSRAAKGADCKSAGLRLRRFESYLSHQFDNKVENTNLAGAKPAIFMSHVLQKFFMCFQWLSMIAGGYTRHARDMASAVSCDQLWVTTTKY
jgi:hypothetical protein